MEITANSFATAQTTPRVLASPGIVFVPRDGLVSDVSCNVMTVSLVCSVWNDVVVARESPASRLTGHVNVQAAGLARVAISHAAPVFTDRTVPQPVDVVTAQVARTLMVRARVRRDGVARFVRPSVRWEYLERIVLTIAHASTGRYATTLMGRVNVRMAGKE